MLAGGAPAVGWFSYAPLSETPYSSSPGVDYWAVALFVLGIGSISFAINTIATVISLRGPGMTMRRLPLFTWINFVNAFIIIFALPVLNANLAMILIDRQLQGHFFLPIGGGSPVLWQHIFWAFGHPEVYIMALPAFAIVSEIIPVFSRKPIFGYEFVAASSVAIAVLSLGVWGHHMFTVGMGRPLDVFFAISSMLIAIPTGVKVLNWTATMLGGRIRFDVPMLCCIAFLIQFLVAGLTGISHASVALDWQTKNSYFLVAHFHFVAVGAIVFAVIGGLQYWFPKMSGRMLSERLGKWTFWLMVIGFNMTFIIQHFLGLVRDAAPCLYLSRSSKLGLDEHALDQRRLLHERSLRLFWFGIWLLHFSEAKSRAITPGTHGPSNGRQRRRRRMKIFSRCRRSAVAAHYGTWLIPTGLTRS